MAALSIMSGTGDVAAFQTAGMGYTCMDMEEQSPNAPEMEWDELSVTGTPANVVGDDSAAQFPLPFLFTYAGQQQFAVNICSNGFLNFGPVAATFTNTNFPAAAAPNGTVAVFWDDMISQNGQMIRFQTFGTQPNRRFVVSWINLPHLGGAANVLITMQVALFETSNAIRMQYLNTSGTNGGGQSATVGIEDTFATAAIVYQFNNQFPANNIYSGLAIGYWPSAVTPPWAAPPEPPPGGGGGGGTGAVPGAVDIDDDEKSRTHRFCGGAAGAGLSFFGLAGAFALIGCFAAGFAGPGRS